jgi:DNA-binding transcriptional LysR family regulator
MDTQHLQAFVAIAESGSFSAAGERLHLTQPAISKRIALLEEQLKVPLFDRIGRQVLLTQAGTLLLDKAKHILNEVTAAQRALADLKGDVNGKLSIATSHHLGLHYLPSYLRSFLTRYPSVNLDLHFLDSEQAYQEILQGRFDIAIITLAPNQDVRISSNPVWQDRLQFVAAPNHPLASLKKIQLSDLSPHQAIMPDTNTHTTQLIKNLFDQEGLPLDITMVTNHLDTIKMMLSIGLGWGVLPDRIIDNQVVALNVNCRQIHRKLGFIYLNQRSLTNAAKAFTQQLKPKPET